MRPTPAPSAVHPRGRRIVRVVWVTAAFIAAFFLFGWITDHYDLGVVCIIRRLTGLECGSCGLSRAIGALVQGHFREALACNLCLPLYAAWFLWVYISDAVVYIRRGYFQWVPDPLWVHYAMAGVITLYGILRNFF